MIKVITIEERDGLDPLLEQVPQTPLLQSWDWGEVLKDDGQEMVRVRVEDDGVPVALATMYIVRVPFGNYMYIPRGPVWLTEQTEAAWEAIIQFARKTYPGIVFIRTEATLDVKVSVGTKETPPNQARDEWAVELLESEAEMLAVMKQKTRYNIRLAQRKGVQVRELEEAEFPAAIDLINETAKRQGITIHSKSHYEAISKLKITKWLGAFFEDELIAAHQLVFFGDTVNYLHGGSTRQHQRVMAPHLMHWREIQMSQRAGFSLLNFGGIAPHESPSHKLANLTRFKKGFGGRRITYPMATDLILKPQRYSYFRIGKRIRRSAFLNKLLP